MIKPNTSQTTRVLLAEDDETNIQVILAYLSALPTLELTVVKDGRAALETATVNLYELMIFDQNMPFITGDRIIRHLQASGSINAHTPVIRLSADTTQTKDASAGSSRNIHLSKPLRQNELIDTIKLLLTNI
ncbi:response regulator [uncultured Thioclava sp.]|jgi:CheY-like chemotaxis protein|uniref:response regulator n=1 Tax=uncultured Thioclava sp. TaxID=473858 RepID=UPI0025F976ED|nr:response regulator [uncultured Thioclava sp.]